MRRENIHIKVYDNQLIINGLSSPQQCHGYLVSRAALLQAEHKRFIMPHIYKVGVSAKLMGLWDNCTGGGYWTTLLYKKNGMTVRAKKYLGQHFLTDKNIAKDIVESLKATNLDRVLEIGPGMGVLTNYLLEKRDYETFVVEIDHESVGYLNAHFPQLKDRIIEGDFLQLDIADKISDKPFALIGNLPYNISSQIFFKVLENKELIPEIVCMLQKEVAQRICSGPGSRVYGILSVFLQAWYNVEYLFSVPGYVFDPPPKVESAVVRLTANGRKALGCDEKLFFRVVKQAFNQRRKMLRNSIRSFSPRIEELDAVLLARRPEQLSVEEFVDLTNSIEKLMAICPE